MRFTHALARRPGKEMTAGITTSNLGRPNIVKALDQFDAYVDALTACGVGVTVLGALEGYPDAHFVEDAAVVAREGAVVTRPGAPSRRGEVSSIAAALQPMRRLVHIRSPGTIDGGDVLRVGRHFFIGLSDRTNASGAGQMGSALAEFGYTWSTVPVAAGLHFKSSVNAVGEKTLLTTRPFGDHPALAGFNRIVVPAQEEYAANTLLVNGHLIMPAGFPDTRRQLKTLDKPIVEVDVSEFRKMDGGLTCLSLRF